MIYDHQFFEIEDQIDKLVTSICQSKIVQTYQFAKEQMDTAEDVRVLKKQFLDSKEVFEQISAFGKYAPDYRTTQRELRKNKRALDLHPQVAEYRALENDVQTILDDVCISLAQVISEDIKVDAGNPFFTKHSGGCGGNCHAS